MQYQLPLYINGKEVEHGQLDLWLIHIVAGSSEEDVQVKTQHAFQYTHYCGFNLFWLWYYQYFYIACYLSIKGT